MNRDQIPDWLAALNSQRRIPAKLEESSPLPGEIRCLLGEEPGSPTCLVYVVDIDDDGLAAVVAVHDDASMATHNDLIVYPENSFRNLTVVLRLPLRATVPVQRLSGAAFDVVDDVAREAIESFEYGDVPVSTVSVGTVTNGQYDARWGFCERTKAVFDAAVNSTWRGHLRTFKTQRYELPPELEDFLVAEATTFSNDGLEAYLAFDAAVKEDQRRIEVLNSENLQSAAHAAILESLDERAAEIEASGFMPTVIENYAQKVDRELTDANSRLLIGLIAEHFVKTTLVNRLDDPEKWSHQVLPRQRSIGSDAHSLWLQLLDRCDSLRGTKGIVVSRTGRASVLVAARSI